MTTEVDNADLLAEQSSGILRLTLNRPAQRNALSGQFIDKLIAQLVSAERDTTVKAVVIASTGTAFCAGHDLNELVAMDEPQRRQLLVRCSELMMTLQRIPQPVIAEVQGVATAAGCQLVASCDLAVAARSATFATPGVDIGLFCSTPAVALSRAVPTKQALRMLFTGEPIDAQWALQIGLISDLVDDGELSVACAALAQRIASKSAACIGNGKQAFYRQQGLPIATAYIDAAAEMVRNFDRPSASEGISAFLQKRTPRWLD